MGEKECICNDQHRRERQRQRQQRGRQVAIDTQARDRAELVDEYNRLKSAVRLDVAWLKAPTADDIEFVNSVYAQTPGWAAVNWATITGKSIPHSNASLYVLSRNDDRVGVASLVEFDGFVLVENFAITPEFNGRGIATIFNEEIIRKVRLHLIHTHNTVVTIPTSSNAYSVEKVGFVRTKSPAYYAKMITAATGLAYDDGWNGGKKEYAVGPVYTYPLRHC